jgi:hypothetical protein
MPKQETHSARQRERARERERDRKRDTEIEMYWKIYEENRLSDITEENKKFQNFKLRKKKSEVWEIRKCNSMIK